MYRVVGGDGRSLTADELRALVASGSLTLDARVDRDGTAFRLGNLPQFGEAIADVGAASVASRAGVLPPPAPTKACPSCGARNRVHSATCARCGDATATPRIEARAPALDAPPLDRAGSISPIPEASLGEFTGRVSGYVLSQEQAMSGSEIVWRFDLTRQRGSVHDRIIVEVRGRRMTGRVDNGCVVTIPKYKAGTQIVSVRRVRLHENDTSVWIGESALARLPTWLSACAALIFVGAVLGSAYGARRRYEAATAQQRAEAARESDFSKDAREALRGSWRGVTDQGVPINFEVVDGLGESKPYFFFVIKASTGFRFASPCSSGEASFTTLRDAYISSGPSRAFRLALDGGELRASIDGAFSSDVEARGTLEVLYPQHPARCPLRASTHWKATRH